MRRRLPTEPTRKIPGTLDRIEVYRARHAAGEKLHHPDDYRFPRVTPSPARALAGFSSPVDRTTNPPDYALDVDDRRARGTRLVRTDDDNRGGGQPDHYRTARKDAACQRARELAELAVAKRRMAQKVREAIL